MTRFFGFAALAIAIALGGCQEYYNVPPNAIGMILTPTGYDGKVLSPGQVNLGTTSAAGAGNRLVLIGRNAVSVNERFVGPTTQDSEDHRCLVKDRAPLTIDVRMLLALPDPNSQQGARDIQRLLLLGKPEDDRNQGRRVMWITASSVYGDQARPQTRGKIRQICAQYPDTNAIFSSFADEGENGLNRRVQKAVASSLAGAGVPLRLIAAEVSNLKPDASVTDAIAAQQAAAERVKAIKVVTDFFADDPTGQRSKVYTWQVIQEIAARANANGHNTIILNGGETPILPVRR